MPPVKCMECMDAGYRMYDGRPSPCPNCEEGDRWAENGGKKLATVPRSDLNPMTLPPGADVLVTEMKRQAAGLPVGVIGTDVLVRAQVEAQPLVHDLVRVVDDFIRGVDGVHDRAVELYGGLPRWAIPDDVAERDLPGVEQPELPDPEVSGVPPAGPQRRAGKSTPPPAAPLEPPGE